jgi:hypothetical protein
MAKDVEDAGEPHRGWLKEKVEEKVQSRRGTRRLFAVLPQFGFATRYLPIDTEVLLDLLSIGRRRKGDSHQQMDEAEEAFKASKAEGWRRLFRLERLRGTKVPGMPVQKGKSWREFSFYMETDGVGCSFICCRPRAAAQDPYTPETVPYDPRKTTFKAIDPGMTNLVTGTTLEPSWDGDGDGDDRER